MSELKANCCFVNMTEDQSKSAKCKGSICFAVNCYNYRVKCPTGVSFHKFPDKEKRPDLYDKWVHNCGRTSQPSHHARICSAHFEERCINRTLGRVEIRENAVPTIFSKSDENRKSLKSKENLGDDRKLFGAFHEPPSKRTASVTGQTSGFGVPNFHSYVADQTSLKIKVEKLAKENMSLKLKLRCALVREKRLRRKCTVIEELLNENKDVVRQLKDKLLSYEDCPVELFAKHVTGYTEEQREFALNLHLTSRKAYKYLRTKVSLPCPRTVRRWLFEGQLPPGVDAELLAEWTAKKEALRNKEPVFDPVFHEVCTKIKGTNRGVRKAIKGWLSKQQSKDQNGMTRTKNNQESRRITEEHTYSSQSACLDAENSNITGADTLEVDSSGVKETDAASNSILIPLNSAINFSDIHSYLSQSLNPVVENNSTTMVEVSERCAQETESNSILIPVDPTVISSNISELMESVTYIIMDQ